MPIQRQPIQRQPIQRQPIQRQPIQRLPIQRQPIQRLPIQRLPIQRQPIQRQPIQQHMLTGNSFLTTVHFPDEPEWAPLENLARIVAQAPQLPQFHPMEFMYMAAVRGDRRRVTVHLYKHIDTRRYVNLDDGGHTYAYQPRIGDPLTQYSGGRYRRYRSMVDALAALSLQAFDDNPPLFRSYPPEAWAT